jgi:small subunit ribosomal protein S3
MGQKVHPTGIRLGISKPWVSTWYASSKDFWRSQSSYIPY